jgi:hypothetical protein
VHARASGCKHRGLLLCFCLDLLQSEELLTCNALRLLEFGEDLTLLSLKLSELVVHVNCLRHCRVHAPLVSGLCLLEEALHSSGLEEMSTTRSLLHLLVCLLLGLYSLCFALLNALAYAVLLGANLDRVLHSSHLSDDLALSELLQLLIPLDHQPLAVTLSLSLLLQGQTLLLLPQSRLLLAHLCNEYALPLRILDVSLGPVLLCTELINAALQLDHHLSLLFDLLLGTDHGTEDLVLRRGTCTQLLVDAGLIGGQARARSGGPVVHAND